MCTTTGTSVNALSASIACHLWSRVYCTRDVSDSIFVGFWGELREARMCREWEEALVDKPLRFCTVFTRLSQSSPRTNPKRLILATDVSIFQQYSTPFHLYHHVPREVIGVRTPYGEGLNPRLAGPRLWLASRYQREDDSTDGTVRTANPSG
jgi:hypothetical protein